MDDKAWANDSLRLALQQVQDVATKPLHVEIERLTAEVEAWRRNTREECEKSTILEARLASVTASLDDAIDGWKSAQAIMSAAERDAERWREFVKRSPLIAASCVAALDAARADGAGEGK